jgi:hypothetical protein
MQIERSRQSTPFLKRRIPKVNINQATKIARRIIPELASA